MSTLVGADHLNHVESFAGMKNVTAILATTEDSGDREFYKITCDTLAKSTEREQKNRVLAKNTETVNLTACPDAGVQTGLTGYPDSAVKTDLTERLNSEAQTDLIEHPDSEVKVDLTAYPDSKIKTDLAEKSNSEEMIEEKADLTSLERKGIGIFQFYVPPKDLFSQRSSANTAVPVSVLKF